MLTKACQNFSYDQSLSYYIIVCMSQTALNIIKLGPGHAFIKKAENNMFIVSTQKKEYRLAGFFSYHSLNVLSFTIKVNSHLIYCSFRIINTNNSKDITGIKQERDEWFVVSVAISVSCQRYFYKSSSNSLNPNLLYVLTSKIRSFSCLCLGTFRSSATIESFCCGSSCS